MKTFQEFCEPKTKEIGAPVEDVSPTMTRWANEYGEYCAGYEDGVNEYEIKISDEMLESMISEIRASTPEELEARLDRHRGKSIGEGISRFIDDQESDEQPQ